MKVFAVRNVYALTLITCPRFKQTKSENDNLSDHLFFYRLWHVRSFIHPSLDINYGFRLDASEKRLWYAYIQLSVISFLYKSGIISIVYHKYVKSFVEIIPLPAPYAMSLSLIDYTYFCGSVMKNCVFIFEKDLWLP